MRATASISPAPTPLGNTVENNIIGLTAAGTAVLGNDQAGVADTAPGTMIGPGNVISANLIGVLISGATATDVTVIGNLIGTDSTGRSGPGQRRGGRRYRERQRGHRRRERPGSQVISGNLVGVKINGASASIQTWSRATLSALTRRGQPIAATPTRVS